MKTFKFEELNKDAQIKVIIDHTLWSVQEFNTTDREELQYHVKNIINSEMDFRYLENGELYY